MQHWHSGGIAIAVFKMKLHTAPSNHVGGTRLHGGIGGMHNADRLLTNKELKRKQISPIVSAELLKSSGICVMHY